MAEKKEKINQEKNIEAKEEKVNEMKNDTQENSKIEKVTNNENKSSNTNENISKEENSINKKEKTKKNKRRPIIVLLFALLTAIVAYILFRGTYLETLEIGEKYVSVFWQNIKYMSITLVINFIIIYIIMYYTNKKIKKGLSEFFKEENKQMPKLLNKSIAFIVAIVVSAITSSFIMEKAILCFNATSFGTADPIFGLDIGYFMFIEPFIELILWYIIIAVIATTIYTVIYYVITFNMFFDGVDRKTLKNSKLIKQVTSTVIILSVLLAGMVILKTQDIETNKFITLSDETTSYSLHGAGFTDVTIKLWAYRILAVVIVVSVYIGVKSFKEGKIKKMVLSIMAVPTYLVALFFIVVCFDAVFVNNNKFDKQKEYIEHNIKYTKSAYGIDIEEINLENAGTVTTQDINERQEVINNIAIISNDIVLKDLKSSQTAKGYYSYRAAKLQQYKINGENKLVYVSPREIVSNTGTYNNKTYEYTHGYGIIATSATDTKENGTLNNIQKGFDSTKDVIAISEPRIYFGLETNDTVVTNTSNKKEFDYPVLTSNDAENSTNTYNGVAGLKLNFIDRIILSIKEGDLKLAFSGNITDESKILTNRNIIERAKIIMPYLMYDENPYLVVNDEGKLIWVLDAYTTSNSYPYAQKTVISKSESSKQEINYIRNSVKVLIDAYDGTINFYITDRTDPIAMAYKNIYSELFVDLEESMPADVTSHMVYPEFLYNIQANIITRYHKVQPDVLFRGDDTWKIATHNTGKVITKTGTDIEPYYTMVKTIDNQKSQLGLVLPYTQYGKQSLISYLVGTYDNSGNGKLTIYKYPADSSVLGPMQLDTQLGQDETISKEIEALNVTGTKIIKNMIVVPLDNTLLYVEPIYQQYINESDALPTLKKVVVASGSKVAIGDNLKEALARLVSQYAVSIEVENTDSVDDLINAIIKANNNLSTSMYSSDWEMMGKDVKRLQELVKKLEEAVEKENKHKNEISSTMNLIDNSNVVNTVSSNVISQ